MDHLSFSFQEKTKVFQNDSFSISDLGVALWSCDRFKNFAFPNWRLEISYMVEQGRVSVDCIASPRLGTTSKKGKKRDFIPFSLDPYPLLEGQLTMRSLDPL